MLEGTVDRKIEETTEIVEIGTGRPFTRNYCKSSDRSSSNSRLRSGSRANTNRDSIRCYACREYDHFARDCPNSREERNLEQLSQMLNMEEQGHRVESSYDDYRSPLNL